MDLNEQFGKFFAILDVKNSNRYVHKRNTRDAIYREARKIVIIAS